MTKIALSGAQGNIGRVLRPELLRRGYAVRSAEFEPLAPLVAGEDLVSGDLQSPAVVDRLLQGVDVLIHLAGTSVERPLDEIIANNLRALVAVYEGARRHRVRRIVFPSSNHAVGMHPVDDRLETDCDLRPDTFYGLSKVWGEALARMYWDKHGIETVCIRIGTCIERPAEVRHLSTWLGFDDLFSLIERCMKADGVGFMVVWGVSNNTRSYWSNAGAAALGYRPTQNAETYAAGDSAGLPALPDPRDAIARRYQGGAFVSLDFTDRDAMNLAHSLERQAARQPDHPLIRFEGRTWTYAGVDRAATRLAGAMRRAGVAKGDRVALYLPNVPEFAISYYAAQKLGAVTVTINAIFKTEEVRFLLDDSGSKMVFTVTELLGFVPPDCPALEHRVAVDGTGAGSLADWLERGSGAFESVACAPDDAAALLYSSGTTGFPKGVTLTQSNIHSNVAVCARYAGYGPHDRLAVFLPLFHVYGQNFIMNAAVSAGATLVLFRRFVPDVVLTAIGAERITMFFGVPTIFIALLGMDLSRYDLSSLRYDMSAAATMPEEISRRWTERFGRRIYEGYGLTECSPFACYNDLQQHRFGSVGRAVDGFELKIFDENDQEAARGTWGEIVIKGPGVMKGYWGRPDETAQALRGGWLHSGDIGRMDADGYVYIVDRVKDMINVAGFKVWPAEVEQYLYKIPGVLEVAVYGVAHAERGEEVAVAVVARPGHDLTAQQVIDYCRANIAAYKVPARVDLVTELPKSATGKILKRVLRDRAS